MKKIFGVVIILSVIAAASYFYKNPSSSPSNSAVLAYVPADTILFIGNLEPVSYRQFEELYRNMFPDTDGPVALLEKSLADMEGRLAQADRELPDGAKLLFSLYQSGLKSLLNGQSASVGFSDKSDSALYLAGALPVARVALGDSAVFSAYLDSVEKEKGITPVTGTVEGVSYREYRLNTEAEHKKLGLVLAIHDNQLAITINTPLDDSKDLKLALSKPDESMANSTILSDLADKYGYQKHGLFFLDNVAVVNGLTDPSANSFGEMVQDFVAASESPDALLAMQSDDCKAEYGALVANWPTLSMGYTAVSGTSASYKSILEGTNTELLETLQRLQGHISPLLANKQLVIGFAMGFNANELAPVVSDLWTRLTSEPYQCQSLAGLNSQGASNPAMALGIAGGMLNGVKGITVGLVDADLSNAQAGAQNPMAMLDSLDMVVSVSADDPSLLLQTMSTIQPALASLNLKDGEPLVDFPMPVPASVKVGLRGHDIVLSMGDKAHAVANDLPVNKDISGNGLFGMAMNMGKYIKLISAAMEAQEIPQGQKVVLDIFKNMKVRYVEQHAITDLGWETDVEMHVSDDGLF